MRLGIVLACLSWAAIAGAGAAYLPEGGAGRRYSPEEPLGRLSFGSCNDQRKGDRQSIWQGVLGSRPDVWLWLGDNIYADKKMKFYPKEFAKSTIEQMRGMYETQRSVPAYRELRDTVGKIVGTWDDHDYGLDDAGKEFPYKKESQQLFLDFLDVPQDSHLRRQEGVYNAHVFGPPGRRVKLVILDTRYHRDPLFSNGDVLGEEQWKWLEAELAASDAQVNIIASSIQFIPNHHETLCPLCYPKQSPFRVESWSHFQREKKRLGEIVARNGVEGVILLSGDVHFGEILMSPPGCTLPYNLFELTSSGMTHAASGSFPKIPLEIMKRFSPNPFGLGMYLERNFGTVDFDWEGATPVVTLSVRDHDGNPVLQKNVSVEDLRLPSDGNSMQEGKRPGACTHEGELLWPNRCRFCIILFSGFAVAIFLALRAVLSILAFLKYCFHLAVHRGETKRKDH